MVDITALWRERPFNSRPHEEVDQAQMNTIFEEVVLQLTTSRRGRLFLVMQLADIIYPFNSRPHEEVDKE